MSNFKEFVIKFACLLGLALYALSLGSALQLFFIKQYVFGVASVFVFVAAFPTIKNIWKKFIGDTDVIQCIKNLWNHIFHKDKEA